MSPQYQKHRDFFGTNYFQENNIINANVNSYEMKKEKNALSKSRERDFTSQITTLPGPKEYCVNCNTIH